MEKFTNYSDIVQRLLDQGSFRDKKHAVTLISRALGISQTSVYNKLGERCRFSLEEFSLLCRKFRLSPDAILLDSQNSSSHFYCRHLDAEHPFQNLISQWIHLTEVLFSETFHQDASIYVFPQTFPIHHLNAFPHVIYLLLFYHQDLLDLNSKKHNDYQPETFVKHHAVKHACQQLAHTMKKIHFMELIHSDMLQGILGVFEELTSSGVISNPSHHLAIREEIYQLVDYFEQLTSTDPLKRFKPNFHITQMAVCSFSGPADWLICHPAEANTYCRNHALFGRPFESKDKTFNQSLSAIFHKKWQEGTRITDSCAGVRKRFFHQFRQDLQKRFMKAESVLLHQEEAGLHPHLVPGNIHEVQAPFHLPSP